MQKLFSVGTAQKEDYPELIALFERVFGDSRKAVNNFFETAVTEENVICVRCGKKIISMLYIIDCSIHFSGVFYKSAYIYAVATLEEYRSMGCMRLAFEFLEDLAEERGYSYLTLVPEEEKLFKMYEKLGFEVGLTADITKCKNSTELKKIGIQNGSLSYELYKTAKINGCGTVPAVILGEKGFNCFFNPVEDALHTLSSADGYCIYEKINDHIFVHESFGTKQDFYDFIFSEIGERTISCSEPSVNMSVIIGMLKVLDDSPHFKNVFFGIPYGG